MFELDEAGRQALSRTLAAHRRWVLALGLLALVFTVQPVVGLYAVGALPGLTSGQYIALGVVVASNLGLAAAAAHSEAVGARSNEPEDLFAAMISRTVASVLVVPCCASWAWCTAVLAAMGASQTM